MIWPRIVKDATVDFAVWVSSPFGPELPDRPLVAMLVVEELDEVFQGISIGDLRVCSARTGCSDDLGKLSVSGVWF